MPRNLRKKKRSEGGQLWLEARFPPPVVMLVLGAAAYGISHFAPRATFHLPFSTVAAVMLVITGLALNLLPKLSFRQANTTVNPLQPGRTTRLITSGIYHYTRNPMYLGHAAILSGWTLHLGNTISLVVVPAFVIFITRFQIVPEERALGSIFSDDYKAFRLRTRRWL